jgi:hypothetical protein
MAASTFYVVLSIEVGIIAFAQFFGAWRSKP